MVALSPKSIMSLCSIPPSLFDSMYNSLSILTGSLVVNICESLISSVNILTYLICSSVTVSPNSSLILLRPFIKVSMLPPLTKSVI